MPIFSYPVSTSSALPAILITFDTRTLPTSEFLVCYVNIQFQSILVRQSQAEVKVSIQFLKT